MIRAFCREYRFWYLMYVLQAVFFTLLYLLYYLPVAYLIYSLLVSTTVLLLMSGLLFYRFRQKMRLLADFSFAPDLYILTKPSDLAYLAVIDKEKEQMQQELLTVKQRERYLKDMVKLWSHQMKVPLSALSLLVQTDSLNSTDVSLQLTSLNQDVTSLLNYLKLTEEVSDFIFEKVDVRPLIIDLVKAFRLHFVKKDISFELTGDWQLLSDRKWLSFALSQILDNALKYNRQGGQIRIHLDQGISIRDTGIGILPEDLPRLFEQGFTGYNGREHQKATGFGLYMTKKILDQLTLTIQVKSQVDQGTTVTITSPKS